MVPSEFPIVLVVWFAGTLSPCAGGIRGWGSGSWAPRGGRCSKASCSQSSWRLSECEWVSA